MRKHKVDRSVEKAHVKKDDTVVILNGEGAGKKGRVLQVLLAKGAVVVEGINYNKKHTRPSKKMGKGGIVTKEGPVALGRVALFCSKCNDITKPSIVSHQSEVSRVCATCKEPIGRK